MSTTSAESRQVRLGPRNLALLVISSVFILWGLGFIYRSSTVAIDGQRYFSLLDDAMISMRYAWNLTHGLGLVWNPGELVEGYSNLLMVLWMAVTTVFLDKSGAVLLVQCSGIAMMLGTGWMTMNIARLTMRRSAATYAPLIEVLAFAAPLTYYPLVFLSLMGMETGLLALLLAWATLASLMYEKDHKPRHLVVVAIALGLAYLTRNDSSILAAIIFVYIVITGWRAGRIRTRPLLAAALVYAGTIALQAIFRYLYYGSLLPNTYFLKLVGMPMQARLENGAGFLAPFLVEVAVLMVAAGVGIVWKPNGHKLYLAAFLIATLAYEMYVGGDYSNHWRLMAPVLPFWSVLLLQSLAEFAATRQGASRPKPSMARSPQVGATPGFLIAGIAALIAVSTNQRFLGEIVLPRSLSDLSRDYVNLSVAIIAVTKPEASVGVVRAGIIPYYTGRMSVDFLGKNDPYIARLPPDLSGQISWFGMYSVSGHNKYDLEYSIKDRLPTYVEGFEWGAQNLNEWARQHYVEVKYLGIRLDLLRDSPLVNWDEVKFMTRDEQRLDAAGN